MDSLIGKNGETESGVNGFGFGLIDFESSQESVEYVGETDHGDFRSREYSPGQYQRRYGEYVGGYDKPGLSAADITRVAESTVLGAILLYLIIKVLVPTITDDRVKALKTLEKLAASLDRLTESFDKIETRLEKLEDKLDKLETALDQLRRT